MILLFFLDHVHVVIHLLQEEIDVDEKVTSNQKERKKEKNIIAFLC